jgi:hypothetical protein
MPLSPQRQEPGAIHAKLYEQIGRLKIKWLKKQLSALTNLKPLLVDTDGTHLNIR